MNRNFVVESGNSAPSKETQSPATPKRQTHLETANEMYKAAFVVKKQRFAQEDPTLSEAELNRKTAAYFRHLAENPKW